MAWNEGVVDQMPIEVIAVAVDQLRRLDHLAWAWAWRMLKTTSFVQIPN